MTNRIIKIAQHLTEKGTVLQEQNKYLVIVPKQTNKVEIKQTVKKMYGVEVEKINIINAPKKTRLIRRGKEMTKRPNQKKAIITIKKGQKLDLENVK